MADKLNLADLTSLTNETSAVTTLNANFAAIETAIDNTLSRDGDTPNTMGADLDLNGNDILNVDNVHCDVLVLGGTTVSPTALNISDLSNGGVQITGGSNAVNLKDVVVKSVKFFGAVGDGVTNDTAAFDAAITWGNSQTTYGVVLVVPPGIYKIDTGTTVAINRHEFWISAYGARFLHNDNALFTWGDGNNAITYIGGGLLGCNVYSSAPTSDQTIVKISGHNNFKMQDVQVVGVMSIGVFGTGATAKAGGVFLHNIGGSTAHSANSIAFDFAWGSGLVISSVAVNEAGVTLAAADRTSLSDALATAIRFGAGDWDTARVQGTFNQYRYGLYCVASTGIEVLNLWFDSLILDNCRTNCVLINPNAGTVTNWKFVAPWFVCSDGHSFELAGSSGTLHNIRLVSPEWRLSGKNAFKAGSQVQAEISIDGGLEVGSNRLSSNSGVDQDAFYLQYDGVTINDLNFGNDGQPFTGVSGNRARYGATWTADIANTSIVNCIISGATGDIQPFAYTTAQTNVLCANNRQLGATAPSYASKTAVTLTAGSGYTNAGTQTWVQPFRARFFITGTTAVYFNGSQIGTDNAQFIVEHGDTWRVDYTSGQVVRYWGLA